MPDRIPTFRPPWINRRPRARAPDVARPNAHQRGYCSQGWKAARREVLLRDNYQCQVCGAVVHGKQAHVDHIVRKADGAGDETSGLQTLCASCHGKKTVREQRDSSKPERWSLHPKWMPRACIPVTLVCGPPASGKSTYVEWKKGDIVYWPYGMPHAMANCGLTPRMSVSITGMQTELFKENLKKVQNY